MRARFHLTLLSGSLLGCLIGCGSPPPPAAEQDQGVGEPQADVEPAEPKVPETKVTSAEGLPIGDPMPPLDSGRIELARPQDWTVPSRDSKYVVQFSKDAKDRFPRIAVTSEDNWSQMGELTADNVAEFAALLAQRLEEPEHKVQLIEPVIPMVIGDTPVARYVRRTKFKATVKSVTVERQILVTLLGGRVYTIDLQTPPGTLVENRDAAYAVAASLKAVADKASE